VRPALLPERAAFRELRASVEGGLVAGAEAGAGPPILMLHGLGGTWQYWSRTMELLAGSARCIALDLPGFGRSDTPRGGFTLDSASDNLAAALRALGGAPAVVCGHSLGGPVAARFALRHPDAISRLVLVGPSGLAPAPPWQLRVLRAVPVYNLLQLAPWPWERWLLSIPPLRRFGLGLLVHNSSSVDPDLVLSMVEGARYARALTPALSASFATGLDDDAALVAAPITAIWGECDRMVPRRDAEIVKRVAPSAEVHFLPGCGHLPMVERPEAFANLLRRVAAVE
jgi:pimeloyl-ACP methyl ester carboxylesterase